MRKQFNIIIILLCFFILLPSKQFAQRLKKNDWIDTLDRFNLEFKMPENFFASDSIKELVHIEGMPIPIIIRYQIISSDSSCVILFTMIPISKTNEAKVKLLYPDHDANLNFFANISNVNKYAGFEEFDKRKIHYFNNKKKNRLNADQAGDYLMQLKKPFENKYNILNMRFIQQKYKSEIFVYCFYKCYDEKLLKNVNNKLDRMLFFKSK